MTFPVFVEPQDDRFTATLAGAPDVCVTAPTQAEAIAALKTEIAQRIRRGQLLSLEIEPVGVTGLAGKYASDPTLVSLCRDAYDERDAERPK